MSRWFLVAAVLGAASATYGGEPAEPVTPYEVPEALRRPATLEDGAGRRLTLLDAIQTAARHNLGVRLQREQLAVATYGARALRGRFEPQLSASYRHDQSTALPDPLLLQQGAVLAPLTATTDSLSIGIAQRLPLGTQLFVGYNGGRRGAQDGSVLNSAGLTLQLTQPLLRGLAFSLEVPRIDILRADVGTAQSREDLRAALLRTVRATEEAYWDLGQALRGAEVQRGSLALGREQLRLTQRQIEAGILPPSDLIAAESTLAQRQLSVVQAESAVWAAMDRLRAVLNLPREAWAEPLLPADPPRFVETETDFDAALATALQQRPELIQRRLGVERARLDVTAAKAERLPQLDLGLSYGLSGQRVSLADTLAQLAARDVPGWAVTATFGWSPLMLAARMQAAGAAAAQRAARLALEQQQVELAFELRDALRGLTAAAREVRAAARFRDLSLRSLDAEQRKFLGGFTSNFVIAQRQADIAQAQLAELQALTRHQKAAVALLAAMGTLLEERGIRL